ncbi:sialic acid synthase SpsE [Curtobacterium sp. PhB137]|nr:sialic acid synthase SpsE [Curtobacterium sp. PhB137]
MHSSATVLAVVPARAGSKGIPGKNLRTVGGRSLVRRAVESARSAALIDAVVVTTDGDAIAAEARAAGADVVRRPADLAGDQASSESALLHVLDELEAAGDALPEILVFLQATSPFIDPDDLDTAIRRVAEGHADVVFAAAPSHAFLWRVSDDGSAVAVNHDAATRPRRQDRAAEYRETGASYVMRTDGFRQHRHRFHGRVELIAVDPAGAIDIDDETDLITAEATAEATAHATADAVAPQIPDHDPSLTRAAPRTERSTMTVTIGTSTIGAGHPAYLIGEIGLNHNGDVDIAKQLIDVAADAGLQAVKFQKRTPAISTPEHMKNTPRSTPWGEMTYLEYRYRVEFDRDQYIEIGDHATLRGLDWFASPWDEPSVDFLEDLNVVAYKIASASVTDLGMLAAVAATGKPVILSTGMSTLEQIDAAVDALGTDRLVLMHATSTYPLPAEEANLRMIDTLAHRYSGVPVGYSGHEPGLQISIAAVALGATAVERHITLDRTMWGSDHAASLEPHGLKTLARDIRIIETALGDGVKRIFPGERAPLAKLRRVGA